MSTKYIISSLSNCQNILSWYTKKEVIVITENNRWGIVTPIFAGKIDILAQKLAEDNIIFIARYTDLIILRKYKIEPYRFYITNSNIILIVKEGIGIWFFYDLNSLVQSKNISLFKNAFNLNDLTDKKVSYFIKWFNNSIDNLRKQNPGWQAVNIHF